MKTIEEKANGFVDQCQAVVTSEGNLYSEAAIYSAYISGATEALANQWRGNDDTEWLQDGDDVIVAIQRIDGSIKYFYAASFYNGKFWDNSDDMEISIVNLWMRLPKPPKDESE